MILGDHLGCYTFEPPHGPPGYIRILSPDRRPYETKDGYVCALIYNDKQWKGFVDVIGKPEILSRPEYATHEARSKNYDTAYKMVADELKKRTTAEWIAAFEKADIPVQKMNSLEDIVADPHLAAIGYLQSVEHPTEGRIKALAVPSEWSESTPGYRRHAPRLGEHTREVLHEAGYSREEIDRLIAAGAAAVPSGGDTA
jgi:crotonobetainyl-CoA:carnitine CoA-transferase CaiB-like acyl-CoA transferase